MHIAESNSTPNRIRHLSDEQHQVVAQRLAQAMDHLAAATSIVGQPAYTDSTLTILSLIRRRLIAPLAEGLAVPFSSADSPYQDLAGVGRQRRRMW
jgi:hypothetical protein